MTKGEFGLLFTDGAKWARAEQLHMALLGLWAFQKREKRLPEAGNLEEAEDVVELANEVGKIQNIHQYIYFAMVVHVQFNVREASSSSAKHYQLQWTQVNPVDLFQERSHQARMIRSCTSGTMIGTGTRSWNGRSPTQSFSNLLVDCLHKV